jgi:hypothetical protein
MVRVTISAVTESEKSKTQHAADDHQEQFEPVERRHFR